LKPTPSKSSKTAQSVQWLGCKLDNQGIVVRFLAGQETCLFAQATRPHAGPPSLVFIGFQRFFPLEQSYRAVKLPTRLHPQPRSRTVEGTPFRSSQPVGMVLVTGNLSGSTEEQENLYKWFTQISSHLVKRLRNYCFFKFIIVNCPKWLCISSSYY
jgi:hypothetical protein